MNEVRWHPESRPLISLISGEEKELDNNILEEYLANMGFIPWNLNLPIIENSWITVSSEVQSFGSDRKTRIRQLNNSFGKFAWRPAWLLGDDKYGSFLDATRLYEQSYIEFFKSSPEVLDELVEKACGVYDTDPHNLLSGNNYLLQLSDAVHIQDIAIRRAVSSLDKTFHGCELIQIRSNSKSELGRRLSPFKIPFCFPESISQPHMIGAWDSDSIEDFYKTNRRIQYSPCLKGIPVSERLKVVCDVISKGSNPSFSL